MNLVLVLIIIVYEVVMLSVLAFKQLKGITKGLKFTFRHLLLYPLILFIIYSMIIKTPDLYRILILASFIVILLSDSFIIYSFKVGIFLFALCHLINGINFTILEVIFHPISIIIGIVFLIINIFLYRILYKVLTNNSLKIILFIYMLIIYYSAFKGIDILLSGYSIKTLFIALGSFLFWLCDVQIAGYQFIKENEKYIDLFKKIEKVMYHLNGITYYSGLILLSFSTWY
jgi:hypothetical protein